MRKPVVALLYDFDETLSSLDMLEFSIIPSLGLTAEAFWQLCADTARRERMDPILAAMACMVWEAKKRGIRLTKAYLNALGRDVRFFPGVDTWFERVNAYAALCGLKAEHYVISAGAQEIIEGTAIARYFERIYALRYHYGPDGTADWPALLVNATGKTEFLYRIAKGVLTDNDQALSRPTDRRRRRVPFSRFIYLGDGLTDVPAMSLTRRNGGLSLAVYTKKPVALALRRHGRVDDAVPADSAAGGRLEERVFARIRELANAEYQL